MSNEPLEQKKVAELRKMAEDLEIEGAEDMERAELIEALTPAAPAAGEDPAKPKDTETPTKTPGEGADEDEEEEKDILAGMTIAELKAEAKAREVDIQGKRKRDDILKAIKNAGGKSNAEATKDESGAAKPGSDDEPETPPDAPINEISEEGGVVTGITGARVSVGSKAAVMKEKLSKQPRVSIMIPLEGGEKFGITHSVILNGYRMNIIKGIYVSVPKQVADVIIESQKQTLTAFDAPTRADGNPMRIEGEGPSELQ